MSKGVLLSVAASVLFGVLYYFSTLLKPLGGEDIFAWRTLLTVPFMLIFTGLMGDYHLVRSVWQRLKAQPILAFVLLLSSALIGVQLWLFMWAPIHNRAMQVSLGYFMLPLTMVLTGRLFYKDKLSGWQKLATLSALIGVAHELFRVGSFSWEALLVALGYPVYFALRRSFKLDHLGGLWFDLVLMVPVAVWFAMQGDLTWALLQEVPNLLWLIPLLGLISVGALAAYAMASRLLSFSFFGLLGYVEPVLLVLVALLLGETIGADEWLTYIPIWLAVLFLVAEGLLFLGKKRLA
jgi:chloramphenicol-sensitive protein RarD